MSQWLQWIILSSLLGNPALAAVVLIVFWWGVDRFTFRFLPNPVALFRRWTRQNRLRHTLQNNPHDRKARYDLAELAVERRDFKRAVELLKPNLEAGDEDLPTIYLMGVACLGAGHHEHGEVLLKECAAQDPKFRLGAIDLELGRWRLQRGDHQGAIEALKRFLEIRHGTVEGRVLYAKALEASGNDGEAALIREEAWKEYAASPVFRRRVERFWAWRAKPSRPVIYAAIALLALFVFSKTVAPALAATAHASQAHAYSSDDDQYVEDSP